MATHITFVHVIDSCVLFLGFKLPINFGNFEFFGSGVSYLIGGCRKLHLWHANRFANLVRMTHTKFNVVERLVIFFKIAPKFRISKTTSTVNSLSFIPNAMSRKEQIQQTGRKNSHLAPVTIFNVQYIQSTSFKISIKNYDDNVNNLLREIDRTRVSPFRCPFGVTDRRLSSCETIVRLVVRVRREDRGGIETGGC